jgi:hypothetical protein
MRAILAGEERRILAIECGNEERSVEIAIAPLARRFSDERTRMA